MTKCKTKANINFNLPKIYYFFLQLPALALPNPPENVYHQPLVNHENNEIIQTEVTVQMQIYLMFSYCKEQMRTTA